MIFYKIEFIIGIIALSFGITILILFLSSGVLYTIGGIIPLFFILIGTYLIYLAFSEVEIETPK